MFSTPPFVLPVDFLAPATEAGFRTPRRVRREGLRDMDHDDDLVMESTTDSAEQIAEGLGIELAPAEGDGDPTPETPAEGDEAPVEPAIGDAPPADDAALETEAEPVVGEVTTHPAKGISAKARPGQKAKPTVRQSKAASGAAAAARRASDAKLMVAEAENKALRERLDQVVKGQPVAAAAAPARVEPSIAADQIPDTHPEIAAVRAQIAKLGPEPKQDDFPEFNDFETKRRAWDRAVTRLEAREDFVREDVARRESIAAVEANRAFEATKTAFEQSVAAAKTRHADYDDQMAASRAAGHRVSQDIGTALMESPVGADVAYYLATHPAEIDRLNGLSAHRQIAEVGILEGRLAAAIRTPPVGTRTVARTTKAPEPQRTVLGDLSGVAKTKDLNDPTLTQAEYNTLRNAMDVASGRRTH